MYLPKQSRKRDRKEAEDIFKKTIDENMKIRKDDKLQIKEAQRTPSRTITITHFGTPQSKLKKNPKFKKKNPPLVN